MSYLIALFIGLASVSLYLCWNQRWKGVFAFPLLVLAFWWLVIFVLGHPKPHQIEWPEDKVLVGYYLDEPKAIYIWVLVDGVPVAYRLPWSKQQANELLEKGRRAEQTGEKVKVQGQKRMSDREEHWFWSVMPPPLKEKERR